jgi:serine/threonine protein kinase
METPKICPNCRKSLPADVPLGLCPECLIQSGFPTNSGAGVSSETANARFVPPPVAELTGLFPQLEILALIGKGGMGAVYQARQPALDRFVALKILPPAVASERGFAERFNREARALAQLNHPNIVAIHDFGKAGALPFLLMEFVDGINLREVERAERLSPEQALAIVPQICDALQFAHNEGVVHRDIKPENILLDKKGRVKITDFGIAKIIGLPAGKLSLTGVKDVVGTPHYMAPEQIEKPQQVDHRADIYSLGVVFYEMLTGELPLGKFPSPSAKVHIDVRLDEIVLRALEKEPTRRYQQISEVGTAVETVLTRPANQTPIQKKDKPMNTQNQKSLWYVLAMGGACIVIGLVAWFSVTHFNGSASQLTREGWQLWQSHQLDEAAAKFRQAVKLAPNDANAWNGLGWALFNSGQSSEAEQAFQKAVALEPTQPGALNGLGQIYLSQGKYDRAETWLLKAAPQAPAAWFGLARLYLLEGKFSDAEKWAQQIVDSGQANNQVRQMLKAAQEKHLSKGLRGMLEPTLAANSAGAVTTNSNSQSAMPAIQAWLKLMDNDDYGQCWETAADSFHDAITKANWIKTSETLRQTLGKATSRKLSSAEQTNSFPGMPDGSYFVARYDTAFANLSPASETVMFSLSPDNQWKAAAYLIQPSSDTETSDLADTNQSASVSAARTWLAFIDNGNYSQSWKTASTIFQNGVTEQHWKDSMNNFRQPLGAMTSRKLKSVQQMNALPGAPGGKYVVMQFQTSFANKNDAIETVTFMLEKNGVWQAAGYFIR